MKALICGLPESLTNYLMDACRHMLNLRHGECDVININNLSPEIQASISRADTPMLLWSDNPDIGTIACAREAAFPVIVLHTDFASAAQEFIHVRSAKLVDTMRVMARAKVALWQIADLPHAHHLNTVGRPAEELLRELAALLHADLAAAPFLLPDASGDALAVARQAYHITAPVISDHDLAVIDACEQFYGAKRADGARSLNVPLCLMQSGTPPHDPLENAWVNLLGPQRLLLFGPFLYLPNTQWKATLKFSICEHLSGNSYMFDIFADMQVKTIFTCNISTNGKFDYACEFDIADPLAPFEIRTHLTKGAIDGAYVPLSIDIARSL